MLVFTETGIFCFFFKKNISFLFDFSKYGFSHVCTCTPAFLCIIKYFKEKDSLFLFLLLVSSLSFFFFWLLFFFFVSLINLLFFSLSLLAIKNMKNLTKKPASRPVKNVAA